jgi:hypothetical protein
MRRPPLVTARGLVAFGLVLAAVAVVVGVSASAPAHHRPQPTTSVALIARRVETLRHLRFRHPVRPLDVTPAEARRDGVGDLDRTYPPDRRRADEETLELLGLLPPGSDLRALLGDAFGEQVAGYYDPHRKRLAVVGGPGQDDVLDQIVLSHELTHALEDQRFGLGEGEPGTDDAGTARTALEEGSATQVMADYAAKYVGPGEALTSALSALGRSSEATKLPRYVQDSLEFPYDGGLDFVRALIADGGWKLVDRADSTKPPASTEQILHPDLYLKGEKPVSVALPAAPGTGWRRTAAGAFGEWDTRELLLVGGVDPADASAASVGWGGGRYALWQRGGGSSAGCRAPCRARDVLAVRWAWDTAKDTREFADVVLVWLARGLKATPAGAGTWKVGSGYAHVATTATGTTLVMAPTAAQAAGLAR